MRGLAMIGLIGLTGLVLNAAPATAQDDRGGLRMVIRALTIPERVAQADVIVIGKVTRIEKRPVTVPPTPDSKDKADYQVAVVEIGEALKGAEGLTSLKVGFLPPQTAENGRPPVLRPGRLSTLTLAEDQELCLFLKPHHSGEFYDFTTNSNVIDKKSPTFDKDLETTRRCIKLLADPIKSLQSKDPADRLFTANILITIYRMPPLPSSRPPQLEPVDAEESKLILHAMADSDWSKNEALGMFLRMNLTAKDGWVQPMDLKDIPAAAEKWVKDNADTYRIQRYVTDKKEKDDKKDGK
jgi:hypothetical protein